MTIRFVQALRCAIAVVLIPIVFTIETRGQDLPDTAGDVPQLGWSESAVARVASPPLGLPPVLVPANNPLTTARISLGRKLFFDRRLSLNNTMSCAMCHIPEQGFTSNELATPIGVHGRSLKRNAPTVLNVAYAQTLFLDGRESSLEAQAVVPMLNGDEMANPSAELLVAKVTRLGDYRDMFEAAFGNGEVPTLDRIASAIACWERTMLAGDSPFDRWRYAGQANALTAPQQRGFELFVGKGQCHRCHLVGPEHALFTDHMFHDTGIGYEGDSLARRADASIRVELTPEVVISVQRHVLQPISNPRPIDRGRFEVTQQPEDLWRFKTPGLRNIALTAPYMHDGSLRTLEDVVQFYNVGGSPHPGLDPLIQPLGLDDDEVSSIVAFLRSLTAGNLPQLIADARSVAVGN